MNVKIFQAFGTDGIHKLEEKINDWLNNHGEPIDVIKTEIAATDTTDATKTGSQLLIVCIWYEKLG